MTSSDLRKRLEDTLAIATVTADRNSKLTELSTNFILDLIMPVIEAEGVRGRLNYDALKEIVLRLRRKQQAAGESDQMLARWIAEEIDNLPSPTIPESLAGERGDVVERTKIVEVLRRQADRLDEICLFLAEQLIGTEAGRKAFARAHAIQSTLRVDADEIETGKCCCTTIGDWDNEGPCQRCGGTEKSPLLASPTLAGERKKTIEECAKCCEGLSRSSDDLEGDSNVQYQLGYDGACEDCATVIRALSSTDTGTGASNPSPTTKESL